MSINTTFWLAIDEDGEEYIHEERPEWRYSAKHGHFWHSPHSHFIQIPKGMAKSMGYNLKPGECMEVTGPNYDPSPIQ